MALAITNENFEEEVLKSDKPVLLDFWAEWCPPCKMVAPIIEKLSVEYQDKVKIAKVDVDAAEELAKKFNISSIPTFVLFKDGELVDQKVGALPEPSIVAIFEQYL